MADPTRRSTALCQFIRHQIERGSDDRKDRQQADGGEHGAANVSVGEGVGRLANNRPDRAACSLAAASLGRARQVVEQMDEAAGGTEKHQRDRDPAGVEVACPASTPSRGRRRRRRESQEQAAGSTRPGCSRWGHSSCWVRRPSRDHYTTSGRYTESSATFPAGEKYWDSSLRSE